MSSSITVRFGTAKQGWLPLDIEANQQHGQFFIAYTPVDPVSKLIEVLSVILDADGAYAVTLPDLPQRRELIFDAQAETVTAKVLLYPSWHLTEGSEQLEMRFEGPRLQVVLAFWRALRELQSRVEEEKYNEHWRRDFPELPMQRLTQRLKKAKSAV